MSSADLIQRLTYATVNERGLFWEAWNATIGSVGKIEWWDQCDGVEVCIPGDKNDLYRRFTAMLDAEAWTSAAEMLVPEGSEWELTTLYGVARAAVDLNAVNGPVYGENQCCLPALALLIAALKAHGGNDAE